MGKGAFFLIALAIGFFVHRARIKSAKRRLADIDGGRRCLSCDSIEVKYVPPVQPTFRRDATEAKVQCLACGYVASLGSLNQHQVSHEEIEALTKPPDPAKGLLDD